MTDATQTYVFVSRIHTAKWVDELRTTIEGWEIKARWIPTGTILEVFLDDAHYTAEGVDRMIRAAGALDDKIHALGA